MTTAATHVRLLLLGVVLCLAAAACAVGDGPQRAGGAATGGSEVPPGAVPPGEEGAAQETGDDSAAEDDTCTRVRDLPGGDVENAPVTVGEFPWDRDDVPVLEGFDVDRIISGGPPPDGIQPVDTPCVETVAQADRWLTDTSPVMVVEVDGQVRAYPLSIMTQHEIVNDVIAGLPVTVTYCPLCNSGLAFERVLDGTVHDFGTSGRLYQSNLVMYDRQTKTLWSQFTGEAIWGDLVGAQLERLPTSLLGWASVRDQQPDAQVLSRLSVRGRAYGRNPYRGYDGNGDTFLFEGPRDGRLPPNTRVVGVGAEEGDPIAIPLPDLRDERVVDVDVDSLTVSVWWQPGQNSALDTPIIDEGRDVGQTRAFLAELPDGTATQFEAAGDEGFTDLATGSTWNLLGRATGGPLEGQHLTAVPLDDTFWFVWFAFQPETEVRERS